MTDNLQKLKGKLAELFQLNNPDLDFGIYRILNAKRDDINDFLNNKLIPQVREELDKYKAGGKGKLEGDLEKAIAKCVEVDVDPETNKKVLEIRSKMKGSVDITAVENEVYSHLLNFFSRYYEDGDFLSRQRVSRDSKYAIPYNGEEVKLHWANQDQYYVKSSEYLRDYAFMIPAGLQGEKKKVHFKLVDADTEKDNTKSDSNDKRKFVLFEDNPYSIDGDELTICFEYKVLKETQKNLNKAASQKILGKAEVIAKFGTLATDESIKKVKKESRTLLDKHLTGYTARNTFDYFIHKDLGGFLKRELDFYIKNEVMHLDDIEEDSVSRVALYLDQIRVIRKVAHKIIEFLAQLENFQKKLWLKKKFVVETNYCMTLDRIPKELYADISANEEQREEWVKLYAIDEIKEKIGATGEKLSVGYSVPLTVEFLEANPFLVVDTKFHGEGVIKGNIISSLTDWHQINEGLVVQGENFNSLRLLSSLYRKTVNCTYIDPPYNTGKDDFLYKDKYQKSSWASLMYDRLLCSNEYLRDDGAMFCSIDRNQNAELHMLLDDIFGKDNDLGCLVWHNARDNNPTQVALEHEYIHCRSKSKMAKKEAWKSPFSDAKEILLSLHEEWKKEGLSFSKMQTELREFIRDNKYLLGEIDRYKFVDEGGIYTGSESVHNPHPGGYEYDILHPETKKPMRNPINGYRFPEKTIKERFIAQEKLIYGPDENRIVKIKIYLKDYKDSLRSVISLDGRLGSYAIKALFNQNESLFKNPKAVQLLQRLFGFLPEKSVILDYFCGSGTSAHAVLNVSRFTKKDHRYISIDSGKCIDEIVIPRLKKVVYSADWKDGKPTTRDTGISHMFKYLRLESYEDCLNNLKLKPETNFLTDSLEEDYKLHYMLDVETKDSLLNVDMFTDPFNYTMDIATGTVGETKPTKVDIVETFNYLLGLKVSHTYQSKGFRVVEGTNPEEEKVLVIWRNLNDKCHEDLDEFFDKSDFNTQDMEYCYIYVNGDNCLENKRKPDQTWKVRLIEQEFKRLMFEDTEL